jgi:hypothetical protein
MGSWKIIEILFPLICLRVFGDDFRISSPSKRIEDSGLYIALGSGNNLMIDIAVTDFPDPDSPTRPTI